MAAGILAVGFMLIASLFPAGMIMTATATERTAASVIADEAFAKIRLYGVNPAAMTPGGLDDFSDISVPSFSDVEFGYPSAENISLEEKIWIQLKSCYDPEIPVNIVDLGLIYDVTVKALTADSYAATITMTLTAPGCGMGPIIAAEAKQKILAIPKITEAEIVMVFDPPWDRSRLSDEAKLALGIL